MTKLMGGRFQFSLMTLLLGTLGAGAALGALFFCFRYLRASRENRHSMAVNVSKLEQLGVYATNYCWQKDVLPESLDAMALFFSDHAQFYTNSRFAELDVGFFTVAGLTSKDRGAVWLFENVPDKLKGIPRVVLTVVEDRELSAPKVSLPTLMADSDFQHALAATLKLPNTRVVANSRSASRFGRSGEVQSDRIFFGGGVNATVKFGRWQEGIDKDKWTGLLFLALAVLCFTSLAVVAAMRRRRRQRAEASVRLGAL